MAQYLNEAKMAELDLQVYECYKMHEAPVHKRYAGAQV